MGFGPSLVYMLIDNHKRVINYVRLAVTDRCNLRCNYCMPESGVNFEKNENILTIEELTLLSNILISQGVDKIRITGGEPFVRKDIMKLLRAISSNPGLKELSITTNGTLIGNHIDELKSLGITHINLSMDAINPAIFNQITRRNYFEVVYSNLNKLIKEGFNLKINFVVLKDQNTEEILPILNLIKNNNISVRFLEEMPFNGGSKEFSSIEWNYRKILDFISKHHPDYYQISSPKTATSINYKIPGYLGSFGVIPSFSRTFCGSCNRLRVTAKGDIITCLYAPAYTNIRDILRKENPLEEIISKIIDAISNRAKDGFEAQAKERENSLKWNSMTSIGG